jgi:single-stranded-DNA-specific exonuclease
MAHANLGVELLLTKDVEKASQLAEKLNSLNAMRQKEENVIIDQIEKYLKEEPRHREKKTLILSRDDLHEGVLGIVASRLVEKLYRPVILISFKNELGKGSGRSIPGINMVEALEACSDYLENYGGHPMAAGIQLKAEKYIHFKNAFEQTVARMSINLPTEPSLEIDYELNFDMISAALIDEINSLQPFGPQNPEPLFVSKNIDVVFSKIIGHHHRRLMIKQRSKTTVSPALPAVWFNADQDIYDKKYFKEIAYRLRKNYWNGKQNIQVIIEDTR